MSRRFDRTHGVLGKDGAKGFLDPVGSGGANSADTLWHSGQDGEEPRLPADLGGGDPWPDVASKAGKGGRLSWEDLVKMARTEGAAAAAPIQD